MPGEKPIGFYLKKADELLSKGIDKVQSEFGINRLEWQILNVLKAAPSANDEIAKELVPFIGQNELNDTLTRLINKEFIEHPAGKYIMTTEGKDIHTKALERQKVFREKFMKDISAEDYQITIHTLEQIINNLEP